MLLPLSYFYQYLTPVLLNNNNNSFINPFLSVLASSTDGLMLAEYENYLEHAIYQLTPGSFDWIKKVTLSSTDPINNKFVVVQTGTAFQSNPTSGLPVVISSSLQDSAISSFTFGIMPLYAQMLISEDLSTVYNIGYTGNYLNTQFGVDVFNSSANYYISPDGSITLNTSTSVDVSFSFLGPVTLPSFYFFNNIPSSTSLPNFYIINGRYQDMKIWRKLGQTILSDFLNLLPFLEQLVLLLDNWMSPFYADVVHNVIYQPSSNYWATRAVQLVFGLPMCVDNNSIVLSKQNSDSNGVPFTTIACSSTDTNAVRLYYALGVTSTSGTFYLSPTVSVGDVLNKYDLFFNQIYVTDYVTQGSFLTNIFKNSPECFDSYLMQPYDYNLNTAVNLLQRRIAAVIIDPMIPYIFTNYLDRISYIFNKRFPAGFGYVTINYTPNIGNDIITSTDSLAAYFGVYNITQTYGINVSSFVVASTSGIGIDEDAIIFGRDIVYNPSGTMHPA